MGERSVIRNRGEKECLRRARRTWDASHAWVHMDSLGPCKRQVSAFCRLRWSLRLPYRAASLLEISSLDSWRRLRWWSTGAFANKGRMEGGQYLAGRRAPPLLHR